MKKFKFLMLAFIAVCVPLVFSACWLSLPLNTPGNVVLDPSGTFISWDKVTGAYNYTVNINGQEVSVSKNSLDIVNYLILDENNYQVKANPRGGDFFSKSSEYSSAQTFEVSNTRLNTPANFSESVTGNFITLNWDKVTGAASYRIMETLDGNSGYQNIYICDENFLNINTTNINKGNYNYSVCAVSNNIAVFSPSEYTSQADVEHKKPLKTPNITSFINNSGQYTISFSAVSGAKDYIISAYGTHAFVITNANNNVNITSLIHELPLSNAYFVCVMARTQEGSLDLDSSFSNMAAYYANTQVSTYENLEYNFFGKTVKAKVANQSELDDLFRFAIFNRITQVNFYPAFAMNLGNTDNNSIKSAIRAFPEFLDLTYTYSKFTTGVYRVNISYNNPIDPDLAQSANYDVRQVKEAAPTAFSGTAITSLPIDTVVNTAVIYSSEQLFWAVQEGYRPVFIENGTDYVNATSAKAVYNRAKEILLSILKDGMTQYERALAIYDWVSYTVQYNHDLVDITSNPNYKTTFSNRGFCLEGVLLDNGYAVCDGIAKTYSLLCNMAGIECVKINGIAGGGAEWGGHAWNKINLTVDSGSAVAAHRTNNWYVVDATWGDLWKEDFYGTGKGEFRIDEALSRRYFLLTDADIAGDHEETNPVTGREAVTYFDYYSFTKYNGVNTLTLGNASQLNTLLNYVNSTPGVNSIEFFVVPNLDIENFADVIFGDRGTDYDFMWAGQYSNVYNNAVVVLWLL